MRFSLSQEILKSYGESIKDCKSDIVKELEKDLKKSGVLEWRQPLIDFGILDFQKKTKHIQNLDELIRAAGHISSSVVPAMNLPNSFESLVENPDIFTEQIQNIAALENMQYKNEYVEVSEQDLTTVIESLDSDTSKQNLEETQDENEIDRPTHKIKVKFCMESFRKLISEIQKTLMVTVALMIILPIPNQDAFITSFGAVISIIEAIKVFIPDDNQTE